MKEREVIKMNDTMNVLPNTNAFGNDPLDIIGKTFPVRLYNGSGIGYNQNGLVVGVWNKSERTYTVVLDDGDVLALDKANIVGFGYRP